MPLFFNRLGRLELARQLPSDVLAVFPIEAIRF